MDKKPVVQIRIYGEGTDAVSLAQLILGLHNVLSNDHDLHLATAEVCDETACVTLETTDNTGSTR